MVINCVGYRRYRFTLKKGNRDLTCIQDQASVGYLRPGLLLFEEFLANVNLLRYVCYML